MNLLTIDTTTDQIILGLTFNNKNYYFQGEKNCKKHNELLLTYVDIFLTDNGATLSDIDVFGVVVGPGSFTGIRIGVATVNAFAMATKKKIVEITSLEQLDNGEEKLVLLDCRHGNYYVGKFGRTVEYMALNESEIAGIKLKKVYLTEVHPDAIQSKCNEKAELGLFVKQAKPFYLKKSSAEY